MAISVYALLPEICSLLAQVILVGLLVHRRAQSRACTGRTTAVASILLAVVGWLHRFDLQDALLTSPAPALDAIIVAASVSCVTVRAVDGLWLHGIPRPSRIFVIVPSRSLHGCRERLRTRRHARCVDERTVVSLDARQIVNALREAGLRTDPARAFWYLQQLIKLQAHRVLDVEQHFVIFDADNVLIRPYHFFSSAGQMRVNIGGHHGLARGYCLSTEALLGVPCYAYGGVVTHQMLVRQDVLEGLLRRTCLSI